MRIAVEAAHVGGAEAGTSSGLHTLVEASVECARTQGIELLFVGHRSALEAELRGLGLYGDADIEIVDAPTVIAADEDPQAACREKPDASILRAAEAVAANNAQALIATGGIGASVAGALWHLKRLRGVLRPVLVSPLPTPRGTSLLLDAGANYDCKPWHILQFALMGSLYAKHMYGIEEPSVGLLAPRMEGGGACDLVSESLPLLKYAGIQFRGMIRGEELAAGKTDVIVTDGCTGDICRGLFEGLSWTYFEMLESEAAASALGRLGAAALNGTLNRFSHRLQLAATGGSPILGIGKPVVLCRRTDLPDAVGESIRTAAALANSDVHERIKGRLEDMQSDMEVARAI
ncbi:MAG: hypothetical protein ABIJ96_14940 [Elusimicrobiota bacterium]